MAMDDIYMHSSFGVEARALVRPGLHHEGVQLREVPDERRGTYMYVVVLRNGPLLGRCYCLTGPYLLFICPTCLVIAREPDRTQGLPLLPPPGPRLCGLCELRYGPWGVALLLLHLLLLLTGGKENLTVWHKHPCCCCCRRLFLPPAAFAAAIVAALPSWWSCCSSCCPSCAHHPYVSF